MRRLYNIEWQIGSTQIDTYALIEGGFRKV